jgi:microcystin-dependent protein
VAGNPLAANPAGKILGRVTTLDSYRADAPGAALAAQAISPVGGSQPHTNFQPYLCMNFIISLFGIFPSPT